MCFHPIVARHPYPSGPAYAVRHPPSISVSSLSPCLTLAGPSSLSLISRRDRFVRVNQLQPSRRLLTRPSPPQRRHRAQGTRREGRGQGRQAAGDEGEEHPVRLDFSSLPVRREFAADPGRLMFCLQNRSRGSGGDSPY